MIAAQNKGTELRKTILIMMLLLPGLTACESMDSARQGLESFNKVLSPLVILKKGS